MGNDSTLTLQVKREKGDKRETSKDTQIGKRGNRPARIRIEERAKTCHNRRDFESAERRGAG